MPSAKDYEAFFDQTDTDKSGFLERNEIVTMMKDRGYQDGNVESFLTSCDATGDDKVSKQEFLEAMDAVPPTQHAGAAARRVFRSFDKDGSGQIDKQELTAVFEELGSSLSADEIERMMELCDKGGDGTIDYEEFVSQVFGQ